MRSPDFNVTKYGIFNSSVSYPRLTTTTPDRVVRSYEIELYPNECQGLTYINGKAFHLPAGTITCAKPGQLYHSCFPRRCYYIHIETEDKALIRLLNQIPDHFVPGKVPELAQLFNDILTVETVDNIQNRLSLSSYVCQLVDLLIKLKYMDTGAHVGIGTGHQSLLMDTEKYIREHLNKDLSLAVLSAYCNLSPAYFQRLFTAYFEKTPCQYVLESRIRAARVQLLVDEQSLSKVAEDCGFASQSYFCCKFKQSTGYTPLQYRKKMLKNMRI